MVPKKIKLLKKRNILYFLSFAPIEISVFCSHFFFHLKKNVAEVVIIQKTVQPNLAMNRIFAKCFFAKFIIIYLKTQVQQFSLNFFS